MQELPRAWLGVVAVPGVASHDDMQLAYRRDFFRLGGGIGFRGGFTFAQYRRRTFAATRSALGADHCADIHHGLIIIKRMRPIEQRMGLVPELLLFRLFQCKNARNYALYVSFHYRNRLAV